jgi:predicted nucleic acid-binding protein
VSVPERFLADASVAFKWCLPFGERLADRAASLLEAHLDGRSIGAVLDLTTYEVGNALLRRGGIEPKDQEVLLTVLWETRLIHVTPPRNLVGLVLDLASAYRLTFYDAAYLAVAKHNSLVLVSDDASLTKAAVAEGSGMRLADVPF